VYRIALVAPFEGRDRRLGYDAFPALRLAVRHALAAHANAAVQIEFVAYNDDGNPRTAARVARSVALDPQVVAVIGHLRLDATLAALRTYTEAGLPVIAAGIPSALLPEDPLVFRVGPSPQAVRAVPCIDCAIAAAPDPQPGSAAAAALADFTALSLGPPPTARSVAAYDAAALAIAAAHDAAAQHGAPGRAGVAQSLRRIRYEGLTGTIFFDQHHRWPDAPAWVSPNGDRWPTTP
jgi:ABC-type branched-subunit amino acid transport system substrate-binding protein